jgi:hypothetical protein
MDALAVGLPETIEMSGGIGTGFEVAKSLTDNLDPF